MAQPALASHAGTFKIGDRDVCRLGFGAMRITGPGIWGPPRDIDEARRVLRKAVELGVTLIDTADSYGPEVSEELIGTTLSPYGADLMIATKGGLRRDGPGEWRPDGRPEHLRQACEGSLRRLGVEQIALYQFHRPDPKVPFEDSIGALADLRREGKIRQVGLSNVSEDQFTRANRIVPIVSVQNRYNLADRSSQSVLDRCEAQGVAFFPWNPLSSGDRSDAVSEVAERRGVPAPAVALAWLLARSPVVVPIPGTGSVAHLEENLMAADVRLSPDELAALD